MEYSNLTIQLIGAFLVLIITLVAGNIFSNIIKRVLKGLEVNKIIEKQIKVKIPLEETGATILKYIIYAIGFILMLNQLNIPTRTMWIIFFILLGILILFLILTLKDIVPNLISGMYINKTLKIKVGETIKVKGIEGKVLEINSIETKIETKNKEIVFIPNTILMKEPIVKIESK